MFKFLNDLIFFVNFLSLVNLNVSGDVSLCRNMCNRLVASSPCFCVTLVTVMLNDRFFLTKFLNSLVDHRGPGHGSCRVRGRVEYKGWCR